MPPKSPFVSANYLFRVLCYIRDATILLEAVSLGVIGGSLDIFGHRV
jgi:hypothetical protein